MRSEMALDGTRKHMTQKLKILSEACHALTLRSSLRGARHASEY